jgi:ATP-dependent Clp protease ATP-binding subunit ClpC
VLAQRLSPPHIVASSKIDWQHVAEASSSPPDFPLTPGAQRLVDQFAGKQNTHVSEWLGALLDRYAPMVDTLVPGLDKNGLKTAAQASANTTAPLDSAAVLQGARTFAQAAGKLKVAERDIAAAVLRAAGYEITIAPAEVRREVSPAVTTTQPGNAAAPAVARAIKPTPTLDKFGRDLTRAAFEGKLQPVVGRAAEIETTMETLCRRTKRNPLLVGPAGTGKTAIVEGLAQRIVKGDVPAPLRGVRLISIQPSSLVAGAGIVGELEKRLGAILAEADQDGVLIFIDEVHAIMGAGGR